MEDRFGYGEIGLDIHPCRGYEDYDEPNGCKSNGGCGKPMTNADRIRAMSDEELAEFMERTKFYVCKKVAEICGIYDLEEHWDKDGIVKEEIEWLKQEAET